MNVPILETSSILKSEPYHPKAKVIPHSNNRVLISTSCDIVAGQQRDSGNFVLKLDGTTDESVELPAGIILAADDAGHVYLLENGGEKCVLRRTLSDGTWDLDFSPVQINAAAIDIAAIVPLSDGRIAVAGSFTVIANSTQMGIALLAPNGTIDSSFSSPFSSNASSDFASPTALAATADAIYLSWRESSRNYVAKLDFDGRRDASSQIQFTNQVSKILPKPDGSALVFTANRLYLTNWHGESSLFATHLAGNILDVVTADGQGALLYAVAGEPSGGASSRREWRRMLTDGSEDLAFAPVRQDLVENWTPFCVASDGSIVASGSGVADPGRYRLSRFSAAGQVDPSFQPRFSKAGIETFTRFHDGRFFVWGEIDYVNGVQIQSTPPESKPEYRLLRFAADGSWDDVFAPDLPPDSRISGIAKANDGKMLLLGYFGSDVNTAKAVLRLDADGSLDSSYSSIPAETNLNVAADAAGRVVTCGNGNLRRYSQTGALEFSIPLATEDLVLSRYLGTLSDGSVLLTTAVFSIFGPDTIVRYWSNGSREKVFSTFRSPMEFIELGPVAVLPDDNLLITEVTIHPSLGIRVLHLHADGTSRLRFRAKFGVDYNLIFVGIVLDEMRSIGGDGVVDSVAGLVVKQDGTITLWSTKSLFGTSDGKLEFLRRSQLVGPSYPTTPPEATISAGAIGPLPLNAELTCRVNPTGLTPFRYQWFKDDVPLEGETAETLVRRVRTANDAGSYTARVTNDYGSTFSNPVTVSVDPQKTLARILTSPQSRHVRIGDSVSLTVTFEGNPTAEIQWYHNGDIIHGATAETLSIPHVAFSSIGGYFARVSNRVETAGGMFSRSEDSATVHITTIEQLISFAPLQNRYFSIVPFGLAASANSGLPVSFEIVAGPATINESFVYLSGLGDITVRAVQPGNELHDAAPPVEHTFRVENSFLWWQLNTFTPEEIAEPGISSRDGDPDGDGFTNLLEYGLGLDPRVADDKNLPELSRSAAHWIFVFREPVGRSDVERVVEVSSDLSNWQPAGCEYELVSETSTTRVWRVVVPQQNANAQFFRLRIVPLTEPAGTIGGSGSF